METEETELESEIEVRAALAEMLEKADIKKLKLIYFFTRALIEG